MLLTITTTHRPATDLGFLLHKHPDRFQSFDLAFGRAHVFYPEAGEDRCTAAMLLDVDPVGMVRRRGRDQGLLLGHYVNDRPYVASSFTSVAISRVLGTALSGTCKDRPQLVGTPIPLVARLEVLPVRGGEELLHRVFEPLGYSVTATRHALDDRFPEWGESTYFSVEIAGTKTLSELLTHLYVLVPVFDNEKHYFVGEDEVEKLLAKGSRPFPASSVPESADPPTDVGETPSLEPPTGGWLASHPEKELITRRFLKNRFGLARQALARLVEDEVEPEESPDVEEERLERPLTLNEQRHNTVLAALRASGARSVLDLGCGEGKLLRELFEERQFERIVGMDVSVRSLEIAARRLRLERQPEHRAERLQLLHGSLVYRDARLSGFDAAAVVEVVEHLDPPRLAAFERVLFEFARPATVVLTTPNREYNVMWETLPAGQLRHHDHRFEWTRSEFRDWAERVGGEHGYTVRFLPVGPDDESVGSPTQMAVFERRGSENPSHGQ